MKIEVNLENSPLSEYFTEENDCVVFTDIFKEEVVKEFLHKMSWDSEFRTFAKNEIKEGLHPKICEWKQDTAIKLIVEELIKEELHPMRSGSYFYMEEYKTKVKEATKKVLAEYVREINALIESSGMMLLKVYNNLSFENPKKNIERVFFVAQEQGK